MRAELELDYVSHGYVVDVFELLRLTCEGHNNDMQNLLRNQPSELTDIDLVGETFKFLQAIEVELDNTNVEQATRTLETLIEFTQGNISKGNTLSLINNKGVELLSRMMEKEVLGEDLSSWEQDTLRNKIAVLLSAMLEGNDDNVEERMLSVVNLKQTLKLANNLYESAADKGRGDVSLANELFGGAAQAVKDAQALADKTKGLAGNLVGLDKRGSEVGEVDPEKAKVLQLDTGFALFLLVKDLDDFKKEKRKDDDDDDEAEEEDIFKTSLDEEALEYYSKYTAHVEIVNSQGQLERVQFRFPTYCTYLDDDTKQKLLWGVDRDTPGAALYEFFKGTEKMGAEMKHLEKLQDMRLWRVLMHNKSWATKSIFIFAMLTNILVIIVDYMEREVDLLNACDSSGCQQLVAPVDHPYGCRVLGEHITTTSNTTCLSAGLVNADGACAYECKFIDNKMEKLHNVMSIIIIVLGVFQIIAAMTIFTLYAMQSGPVRQDELWRKNHNLSMGDAYNKAKNNYWFGLQFVMWSAFYLFLDLKLIFFCFEFVATLLGIAVSRYFFAVLLVDIAVRDADLQNVFRSVTEHGRSIMVTAFFGAIVIYFFSIFALLTLQANEDIESTSFYISDPGEDPINYCENLLQCTANVMTVGLRKSDIGEIMNPRQAKDPLYVWQLVYAFLFWALIIIILLNIIFGIIIDTFGELRTAHLAIKQNMENTCFICRSDRFVLDTKGGGFESHVKSEHNMWHYLFAIIHIREKDRNDYNGWEDYVADLLEKEDLNFFPQLDALSLEEFKAREKEEARKQQEVATNTAKSVEALEGLVQQQMAQQEKLLEEVRDLQGRIEEPGQMQLRLDAFMKTLEAKLDAGSPQPRGDVTPRASARG